MPDSPCSSAAMPRFDLFVMGQVRTVIKARVPFIDACNSDELFFDKPRDLFL